MQPFFSTMVALPVLDTSTEAPSVSPAPPFALDTMFLPLMLTAPVTPWSVPIVSWALAAIASEPTATNTVSFFIWDSILFNNRPHISTVAGACHQVRCLCALPRKREAGGRDFGETALKPAVPIVASAGNQCDDQVCNHCAWAADRACTLGKGGARLCKRWL